MAFTISVLDHGFVTLRNIAGPTRRPTEAFDASSIDPANSARMSFNKMDKGRTFADEMRLVEYLMKHMHNTPIEMIEVWLEMKMPIFIARQFVRHRTATINEVSARYVQLPQEWYIPEVVGGKAKTAKQGQEDNLDQATQDMFKSDLECACRESYREYQDYLGMGVAPEHARMFLHVNHYTHWLWKQDLHNMMHFLACRQDSHAQIEAQLYGNAIVELLIEQIPELMDLYVKYRKKG